MKDALHIASPGGPLYVEISKGSKHDPAMPPLILLHDSLGCISLWRDFPEKLAQACGRSVVAYDRLGFGQSAPHPASLPKDFIPLEAQTNFKAVVEHLGIQEFALLGHSVGGGMALAVAAAFAARCRAVITESAQAFVEDRTLAGIARAQQDFLTDGQMQRLAKYHGEKARWVLQAWVDTWLSPSFRDWSLDQVLPSVQCPVLAIHGTEDEYGTCAHPQRIQEAAGGAVTIQLMPGVGHVPHREQEAHVITLVRDFLATAA